MPKKTRLLDAQQVDRFEGLPQQALHACRIRCTDGRGLLRLRIDRIDFIAVFILDRPFEIRAFNASSKQENQRETMKRVTRHNVRAIDRLQPNLAAATGRVTCKPYRKLQG